MLIINGNATECEPRIIILEKIFESEESDIRIINIRQRRKNFFQKFYGKLNVEQKLLHFFVKELTTLTYSLNRSKRVAFLNLEKLKFFYSVFKDIISVLCTDQIEDIKDVDDKLIKVQEEFIKRFNSLLKEESKPETKGENREQSLKCI